MTHELKGDYGPVVLFKIGPILFTSFGFLSGIGAFFGLNHFLFYIGYSQTDILSNELGALIVSAGFAITVGSYLISRVLDLPRVISGEISFGQYIKVPGFGFWGGATLGTIVTIVFSFQYEVPLIYLTDALVLGIPLGQLWGRIGCLNYGCCHGRECKENSWGIIYKHPDSKALRTYPFLNGVKLYPTQIYSAVINFLIYVILCVLIVNMEKPIPGLLTTIFLILFGFKRFIIEFFRGEFPRTNILGLTIWQWFAVGIISMGLYSTFFVLDFNHYKLIGFSYERGLELIYALQPQILIASFIITLIFSVHVRKIGTW